MIEALTSHTAQEALTDGIGAWSVIRGFENLDATRLGNLSEAHTKLAIIIPDEVCADLYQRRWLPESVRAVQASVGERVTPTWITLRDAQFDEEEGLPASGRGDP
jgi:hypothetical protein